MEYTVHTLIEGDNNVISLLVYDGKALLIDAGFADPVCNFLQEHALTLEAILITHHHADHTQGIVAIKEAHPCVVYAPDDGTIEGVDLTVADGETVDAGPFHFQVIHTPGHTNGHVVYHEEEKKLLFSGDTLFTAGCGRLFEGTPEQMYGSFLRIGALSKQTTIYPGHDYGIANLHFALGLEPNNTIIKERLKEVEEAGSSVPTTLEQELETNPFLRVDDSSLRLELSLESASSTEVFADLRAKRDVF